MPESQDLIISQQLRAKRHPLPILEPVTQAKSSRTPQPLNWQQFTLNTAVRRTREVSRRKQLVTSGLMAIPPGQGRVLFLGAIGWVAELAIAGEYVAQKLDRYVEAYDNYSKATGSILDGPRARAGATHFETPPTIHGRVRMHDGWPELGQDAGPLLFCCLAADNIEPLLELPRKRFNRAALIGKHDSLQALSKACKFGVLPIAQWEDWFLVKAHV